MFWEKYELLCKKNGKSPNTVGKEIGVSSGSIFSLTIKNKARSIIGSGLYSYRYMFFFDELGKEKHLTFYLIVAVTDSGYADVIAYYGSGDYKEY